MREQPAGREKMLDNDREIFEPTKLKKAKKASVQKSAAKKIPKMNVRKSHKLLT